ncbi:MAG TPA: multifunctional CCA tRNA nucleotidyl transferase/2'3'-cyclic phosphodiesterase/2'nucleotidase/phosphatase [Burkholderiales bacterium]|nr:multifunctional CCA tRNA nucleotidyl transferase/2'3'-cyclic phosphodiesterase/2'nucleotidase/phosphatase [Burkholderiales bacterium]
MKTYAVGGAVRDELLGLQVADRDYVVVGSTPEEMVRLGYKPVGKDFPVFLHPATHEEHALARTERKVARGYKGFQIHAAPDVTLEQDLERRDLTINAMARDEAGQLVDPFGGAADLERGLLRHVSPAFVEDPVRILRVARFAARFGFAVAPETMVLMRAMVSNGEADALVPERVWQEFSRGLMEGDPALMFPVLAAAGLLEKLLPELKLAFEEGRPANDSARVVVRSLECAAAERLGLAPRFALIASRTDSAEATRAVSERLKAPGECRDLALLAQRHAGTVRRAAALRPLELLGLLESCDAFRRPERLEGVLAVSECLERGAQAWTQKPYTPRTILRRALAAATRVNASEIAANSAKGDIPEKLHRARVAAIGRSSIDLYPNS